MNKITFLVITVVLLVGLGIIFIGGTRKDSETVSTQPGQNVGIRDDVQYITIDTKGGYSPRVSSAQADIPTKLILRTNSTYDCSSALIIRSIGYQKMLPPTGEEVIDIGISQTGTSLQGTCSMGMYSFTVNFI